MNKKLLAKIKEKYENNENIIKYLKSLDGRDLNNFEDIMISYDFQAGTYVNDYEKNKAEKRRMLYYEKIAEVIGNYLKETENATILDVGCGEATTMAEIYKRIGNQYGEKRYYGLDASYSRLKVAEHFLEKKMQIHGVKLMMGDMKSMPVQDSACDIVYTVHACEPNGGSERIILEELMRITRKYLILFEPAYDLASEEAQKRMREHGYVTKLIDTIHDMGLDVKEHRLLGVNLNDLNPTGVTVIEKQTHTKPITSVLADPISKKPLTQVGNVLWCEDSMLIYPIMENIMCLTEDNAVIATKFGLYR